MALVEDCIKYIPALFSVELCPNIRSVACEVDFYICCLEIFSFKGFLYEASVFKVIVDRLFHFLEADFIEGSITAGLSDV